MGTPDWPDSREQLLKDIETFSEQGALQEEARPAATIFTPAARPTQASAPVKSVAMSAMTTETQDENAHGSSALLSALKQQATAKLQGNEQKSGVQELQQQRISEALKRAFMYFSELTKQLDVLKPAYEKTYSFFGVADFNEMHWVEGRADYRVETAAKEDRLYTQATLRYRLAAAKQFRLTRENPALEKLRKALFDHGIVFTTDEHLNDRARVERATFTFPCEIKAGLLLMGDASTGELLLRTRNIERFGVMEYRIAPETLTTPTLDELTLLILGKPSRINQILRRVS